MSAHDLNLLALGAAAGAYVVLLVWMLIAFRDDLRPVRPARIPVQSDD
jgi:hypothetical protein